MLKSWVRCEICDREYYYLNGHKCPIAINPGVVDVIKLQHDIQVALEKQVTAHREAIDKELLRRFSMEGQFDKLEGKKHDGGKPPLALLSSDALIEISKVLDFGQKKYDAWNWKGGFKWSRLVSALLRHVFAWLRGEDKDPESGLSHLAHAGCCLMFLLDFEVNKLGEDDRYRSKVS